VFRPGRPVLQIAGFGTVTATRCEAHTEGDDDGGASLVFKNDTTAVERLAQPGPPDSGWGVNLPPNQEADILSTFSNGRAPSGTQITQIKNVGSGRVATVTASVIVDAQGCHFFVQAISS
jgi:hypothetical protein